MAILLPHPAEPLVGPHLAIRDRCNSALEEKHPRFGAGSGVLAKQILESIEDESVKYYILELSNDLKGLQQRTLSDYAGRVVWLDQLPESFIGCVVANEVLDAMPVRLFTYDNEEKLKERYVDIRSSLHH